MSYLNLDIDFFTHPKTMRLIGLLGKDFSPIFPIRLWCYVGKYHSENGKLVGYSIKEVESIAGWIGLEGLLVDSMVQVGFLKKISNGYEIKDWLDHEGHLKMFKLRARNASAKRWGLSNPTSNAKGEAKQSPKPNQTKPYQTKPNQTKPTKREYGEFHHILLTDQELQKLKDKLGEAETLKWIKTVDEGIECKGYKYKNHYLTILKWKEKDNGASFKGINRKGFGDNTAGTEDPDKYRKAGIPE